MIPDFKTYIDESVWNDIRKRGNGTDVKKEDDIEHLDRDDMFDYIYTIYHQDPNVHVLPLKSSTENNYLYFSLPMFMYRYNVHRLVAYYTDGDINKIILFANEKECVGFYKELTDNFKIYRDPSGLSYIKSKDNTISNKLLLDVIDTISTNAEKPILIKNIDESVWGDIRKRGNGSDIKKEDDIDHFGYEEFFVYLSEHYQPKSKKINEKIGGRLSITDSDIIEIFIPIESIGGRIKTLIIEISKKDNSVVSMATSPTLFDKYVNLERMLNNRYTLTTSRLSSRIYLRPKKKPTNKSVVDLIDTFLVVVDNPILEKVS